MSQPSIVEKLHLNEERNLLIQGLPSSIEKQFAKLSFSKNVTPLLRSKKIDWALVFAVNENQLNNILKDVLPALHEDSKLWVAYPKSTSKITSDLNRDCSWSALTGSGYEGVVQVALDHVWSALWWKKCCENGKGESFLKLYWKKNYWPKLNDCLPDVRTPFMKGLYKKNRTHCPVFLWK